MSGGSIEAAIHKAIAPFMPKRKQGYAMGKVREALAASPPVQPPLVDEEAFFAELRKHADYDEADSSVGLSDCWNVSSEGLRAALAAAYKPVQQ